MRKNKKNSQRKKRRAISCWKCVSIWVDACSMIILYNQIVLVVSYSTCSSPQLDQVQESARPQKTIGERFMVKEESAASVGTRPWTPEGRSLTLCFSWV
ncbi:hypothetical protein AVEN_187369-1 [Araneus ventricosus]|uniref:Uncharacterized protein n=1 Tax=Araneus ventricosus TaxID=182803 RepID=A0A4Y2KGZ6_ARAVE|nr:hypothetical protein AVEN_187369-1 [Araneus ventricosus]